MTLIEKAKQNLKLVQEIQTEYGQINSLIDSGNLSYALQVAIDEITACITELERMQQYTRTGIELSRTKRELLSVKLQRKLVLDGLQKISEGILPNGDHVDGATSEYAQQLLDDHEAAGANDF